MLVNEAARGVAWPSTSATGFSTASLRNKDLSQEDRHLVSFILAQSIFKSPCDFSVRVSFILAQFLPQLTRLNALAKLL